jgi:hypothetical protein
MCVFRLDKKSTFEKFGIWIIRIISKVYLWRGELVSKFSESPSSLH